MSDPHIQHRLFVVGCPRSGTTLLQAILAAHSQLLSCPETDFFRGLFHSSEFIEFGRKPPTLQGRYRLLRRRILQRMGITSVHGWLKLRDLMHDLGRDDLERLLPSWRRSMGSSVRAFRLFLDTLALEAGKTGWIEKTPDHVHYAAAIMRHIPGARFLHLIRDPRAVIASLHDASQKYPDEHWRENYSDLDRCIDRWRLAAVASLKWSQHPSHMLVDYERLTDEPQRVVRGICRFTGLPFEPAMLSQTPGQNTSIIRENEAWKSAALSGVIRKAPSKFTTALSPQQQSYVLDRLAALNRLYAQSQQAAERLLIPE